MNVKVKRIIALLIILIIFFPVISDHITKKIDLMRYGNRHIDGDCYFRVFTEISDQFFISDLGSEKYNVEKYESGIGWKFFQVTIMFSNKDDNDVSFQTLQLVDKHGLSYSTFLVSGIKPRLGLSNYTDNTIIQSNDIEWISFAYKLPISAVPEKLIYTDKSFSRKGEIYFKK